MKKPSSAVAGRFLLALLLAAAGCSSSQGLGGAFVREKPEALVAKLNPDKKANPAAEDAAERLRVVYALRSAGDVSDSRLRAHVFYSLELISISDEDPAVRMAAISVMTDLGGALAAEPACRMLLQDDNPICRDAAARCIGKLRRPETLPQLEKAFGVETNPFVKGAVVRAAACLMPDPAAKVLLQKAAADPDPSVSLVAKECLREK